jgi:Asp/Glu/hydantoin racemase
MRGPVAFLHTSPVHVETFDRLVKAAEPALRVDHIVDEALLSDARRVGVDDPPLIQRVQRAMTEAAAGGATAVVCTCSTIGSIAERTPPQPGIVFARIDRAMADRAVRLGPRILVVAALRSTLAPTAQLIAESATALQTPVQVHTSWVEEAWPHFERGDRGAYIGAVVAAVRAAPRDFDVVVLAQASMADAADALSDLGVEVLSSPRLGVQALLASI